jgi:hypothetical protein
LQDEKFKVKHFITTYGALLEAETVNICVLKYPSYLQAMNCVGFHILNVNSSSDWLPQPRIH